MRIIGNLLWWLFGGLEAAIGYFTGSLAMAITIIGIPFAKQHFSMAYSLYLRSCCSDAAKCCGGQAVWCRNQSC